MPYILQSMPTDSTMENHQDSISCYYISSTHRRFQLGQIRETHNCRGLPVLPKGKINHVSKLISSISPNGLAYWSENYLSLFGYCIVLHLLHCIPPLFAAQASVLQDACEPKNKSIGPYQTCKNPINHTKWVSEKKHKSPLSYDHSKNKSVSMT